jgi:iron only hydrogenase large subunit-like protein
MANELKRRIDSGINLPMISSNCPAWVTFVRKFYPHLTPMLSSCKSPQLIMGALIKSFFAEDQKINPKSIFSVALTSCLARKAEIQQMEMVSKGLSDVDAALSARELVQLIRLYGIDLANITPQQPDSPFNVRSTAGKLLTNAGGTSEALVRTLHPLITGKELTKMKLNDFRSFEGTEEVNFSIGKVDLKVTLSNGLTGINELVVKIELNTNQVHFFEIMACPGGCINGGGQPIGSTDKENKIRAKTIYDSDDSEVLKVSHNNSRITEMYSSYLKEPRSNKVENLLQVNYHKNNQLPKR